MKILGAALLILGLVGLVFNGLNYTRRKAVLEVDSSNATASEQSTFPIPPIVGALALIGGIVLVSINKQRA